MADVRPNIIFIMTDQMRHDAIGAVTPYVHTPGIDSLARDGILYDQAVCQCPMCVPSRNSMMFGMYPSQCGVHTNNGALLDESRLPGVPLRFGATMTLKLFSLIGRNYTTSGRNNTKVVDEMICGLW